jgi:hypothetical protein
MRAPENVPQSNVCLPDDGTRSASSTEDSEAHGRNAPAREPAAAGTPLSGPRPRTGQPMPTTPPAPAVGTANLSAEDGAQQRRGRPTAVPLARGAFLVSVASTQAEGRSEFTAHIKPVDNAPREIVARGFKLGDAVLDVVGDLLVELVREDASDD